MRLVHALAKMLLIVAATVAGAGAGGALGVAGVATFMPDAGLDGLPPVAIAAFFGSVLGTFTVLSVLFKLPRLHPRHLALLAGVAVVGGILGLVGQLAIRPDTPDPAWGAAALSGWGFAGLALALAIASLLYGKRPQDTSSG